LRIAVRTWSRATHAGRFLTTRSRTRYSFTLIHLDLTSFHINAKTYERKGNSFTVSTTRLSHAHKSHLHTHNPSAEYQPLTLFIGSNHLTNSQNLSTTSIQINSILLPPRSALKAAPCTLTDTLPYNPHALLQPINNSKPHTHKHYTFSEPLCSASELLRTPKLVSASMTRALLSKQTNIFSRTVRPL